MKRDAAAAHAQPAPRSEEAESPTLRLFALLERIAAQDRLFSLQSLVEDTGWPKPSVHRMLQQLEAGGLVQREGDSRHYSTGLRLRRFAENLLANGTFHGARHRVLRALVDEVGESCNITAFVGGEVVYLDRVETAAPLRFYLHPGSRVPAHASASGKIFLSQMPELQRTRLLQAAPLERCTPATLTSPSSPPLAALRYCTSGRWVSSDGRFSGSAASNAARRRRNSSLSLQRGNSSGVKRLWIWASLWNATGASLVPTATMAILSSLERYFSKFSEPRCSRALPASRWCTSSTINSRGPIRRRMSQATCSRLAKVELGPWGTPTAVSKAR